MHWTSFELQEGWRLLAVDVYLTAEDQPEVLVAVRYAVHPSRYNPSSFREIISEMQERVLRAAQPLPASRACAFGD